MRRFQYLPGFVTLAAIAIVATSASGAELTIQADQPGKPISPDLLGVFFEDLNYASLLFVGEADWFLPALLLCQFHGLQPFLFSP